MHTVLGEDVQGIYPGKKSGRTMGVWERYLRRCPEEDIRDRCLMGRRAEEMYVKKYGRDVLREMPIFGGMSRGDVLEDFQKEIPRGDGYPEGDVQGNLREIRGDTTGDALGRYV